MIPVGTAQAASSWTDITHSEVFSSPYGVAVDSSDNVYVTDYGHSTIKELTNGSWKDIAGSGVPSHPYGVAVDSSDNVYVTDVANNTIKELTHGSSSWTDITGSGGFDHPFGVAVDSSGNVYVADYANNKIKELTNGAWTDITHSEGFNSPYGVAVDRFGNVYVTDYYNTDRTDYYNTKIKELTHGSSSWTDITDSGGFTSPYGVAVDSSGNVYVADLTNNKIKELTNGSSSWTDITDSEVFGSPYGVAVDGSGNVYATDRYTNKIMELPAPTPPTVITAVSLTGVVAPVTGATPEVSGSLTSGNPSEYTVTSIKWENSGESSVTLDGSGNFIAGSTYQVGVTLTSAAGYDFPTSGLTPTVDVGMAGAGTGYGTGNTSLDFLVTFPATVDKSTLATAITNANTLITSLTVGTAVGDVSSTDAATFQAAITAAQVVDSSTTAVQADVNAQVLALATATTNFNSAVITVAPDTDATLSNLDVDGTTVVGFTPTTTTYSVVLPTGTTAVPTVTATATDSNATAVVTAATVLPGSTTVLVTAPDGTSQETYTISFTVAAPPSNNTGGGGGNGVDYYPPVIQTEAATSITAGSAVLNGDITSDNNYDVTDYGFLWGTNSSSLTGKLDVGTSNISGGFTATLGSLTAGTTYYFQAYATNSQGTADGAVMGFTAGASQTTPTTPVFSDVSASYWGYDAISSLSSRGIVSGYPDGTFKPDASITRAEFATMLVKALGLSATGTAGKFTDVTAGAWYYGTVNAAASAGLVSGPGDNLFAPTAPVYREQMAVMVAKAMGNKAPATNGTELNAFSDKSAVSSWAVSGMDEAVKAGIVSGMTADTLVPLANATRAQAAAMIYQLLAV
jgi:hypothetical protein